MPMICKVARTSVALLVVALLIVPAFAQGPTPDPNQNPTLTKQQQAQLKKEAEQKKKEAEQQKKLEAAQKKQEEQQKKKMPKNSDIDNIGNRNINKGSINFTSIEKEIQLGRQLSAEIERQVKLNEDAVINEYV